MNDGKPTDETQAHASASAGQAAALPGGQGPDARKRRLLRGAVGIAPVIITLRSGSLAAASCVGAKALGSTSDPNGDFTIASGGPINPGDRCVAGYTQTLCSTPKIDDHAHSTAVGAGTLSGSGTGGDPYKCSGITGANPNVAIVSVGITSFG
jgi:hypothetical protein